MPWGFVESWDAWVPDAGVVAECGSRYAPWLELKPLGFPPGAGMMTSENVAVA